jgi:hypothetical protein
MNININDLKFSTKEKEFYEYLFISNKKSQENFIEGPEVAGLLKKANLNNEILKNIWVLSSLRKMKNLNLEEFGLACRLVVLAQQGKNIYVI